MIPNGRGTDVSRIVHAGPSCAAKPVFRGGPYPSDPWREMPKRVRPYGSAADAESAALARGRPRAGGERVSEPASAMMVREIASQAAEATRALNDLTSDGAGF